ncbi:hypothetical protein B0J18DRAFT_252761 [Chaetomium sp. MPI-SDFR-AT-0129]|nr:hypothetical protein B0J18DRAFT_252761 [Chaetomium sp. MPI-SDFR-AT-0129]
MVLVPKVWRTVRTAQDGMKGRFVPFRPARSSSELRPPEEEDANARSFLPFNNVGAQRGRFTVQWGTTLTNNLPLSPPLLTACVSNLSTTSRKRFIKIDLLTSETPQRAPCFIPDGRSGNTTTTHHTPPTLQRINPVRGHSERMRWRVRATRPQAAAFDVPSFDKGGVLVPRFHTIDEDAAMDQNGHHPPRPAPSTTSPMRIVHTFFRPMFSMWWR